MDPLSLATQAILNILEDIQERLEELEREAPYQDAHKIAESHYHIALASSLLNNVRKKEDKCQNK